MTATVYRLLGVAAGLSASGAVASDHVEAAAAAATLAALLYLASLAATKPAAVQVTAREAVA